MSCDLLELKTLVPPPPHPARPAINWSRAEEAIGHALPTDYERLVAAYGAGSFDQFLWVLQPTHPNHYLDMAAQRTRQLWALRHLRDVGEPMPFDVEGGELIPWAITDNGDVCYWVCRRNCHPDAWTVTAHEARGPRWFSFDMTLTEFLIAVLRREIRVDAFPPDFPSETPLFYPLAEDED